jgi:hypothetical protein
MANKRQEAQMVFAMISALVAATLALDMFVNWPVKFKDGRWDAPTYRQWASLPEGTWNAAIELRRERFERRAFDRNHLRLYGRA